MTFVSAGCLGAGEGSDSTRLAGAPFSAAATSPPVGEGAPAAPKAAGSATLSWNPPTANADGSTMSDLAGYRIYYGTSATRLDRTIVLDNPGLTRYVVENLAPVRWHFAMTSVNASGKESKRSKTASKTVF